MPKRWEAQMIFERQTWRLPGRKCKDYPGIIQMDRIRTFLELKLIQSFMFHGTMQVHIAPGQSADCQPRRNGRRLPPGMIVQAKNMRIPGGMSFMQRV